MAQESRKLCHIVKRKNFDGYGFNLHSEKIKPGQYIGKVDNGSPAEEAGLKKGDRILEVNGVPIDNETHKQVVQRIKAVENEVRLLLLIDDDNKDQQQQPQKQQQEQNLKNIDNTEIDFFEKTNTTSPGGMVYEQPGASANISSISISCTKKTISTNDNNTHNTNNDISMINKNASKHNENNNNHNTNNKNYNNNNCNNNDNSNNNNRSINSNSNIINNQNSNNNGNSDNDNEESVLPMATTGNRLGLKLPITAAEMRAQLLAKKKYDPKNESVDLKKKFEIIQKL